MNQEKINQLAQLLKRMHSDGITTALKLDTKKFLAGLDPTELPLAEQTLTKAGLNPESLQHICTSHAHPIEMANENLAKRCDLPTGHMIDTLQEEHEMILSFLDKLEHLNQEIQKMEAYRAQAEEWHILAHVIEHLIHAEPHHEREEDILFPELEKRGVFGPPQVMVKEHEVMGEYKAKLGELIDTIESIDFNEFKKELDTTAKALVSTLREHIFKENNILYPTALDMISEPEVWQEMKSRADEIGYCCFTPKK